MGQRKVASRAAQWPLLAEFVFSWDDTMIDVNGAVKDFKTVGSNVFVIIPLPPGAVVEGGEVVTEQAWAGGTCSVAIGDSVAGQSGRYFSSVAVTTAGRLPMVPTGYVSQGENLQMSIIIGTATATAGKTSVKVWYMIRDRANEVNPT